MRVINSHIKGSSVPIPPNTFIGGVGSSYITSAADFATLTNLSVNDIKNFQIDGMGNVSFYVDIDYDAIDVSMYGDDSITWIIDRDEHWVMGRHCNNANSLKYFYAPRAQEVNQFTLSGCELLKKIKTGVIETNGRFYLSNNDNLKKVFLDTCTTLSNSNNTGVLTNLSAIERLYIGNVTSVSNSLTKTSTYINPGRPPFFYGSKFGCKIYHHPALGVDDRKAFTRLTSGWNIGDTITVNGLVYTCVTGTPTSDGEFNGDGHPNTTQTNFKNAINNDTRIGIFSSVTAQNDNSAMYIECDTVGVSGEVIEVIAGVGNTGAGTISWSPLRHGHDVHRILIYARDERLANLVEVSAPIFVNPPTLLSYSNLTSTTVDLNFTEPTANVNGTECYEVWVDDGTPYRKLFEYDEISASGDTLDLTEVVNDTNGNGMTGLKIKIRTMDGQMNYSEFSNEITLP